MTTPPRITERKNEMKDVDVQYNGRGWYRRNGIWQSENYRTTDPAFIAELNAIAAQDGPLVWHVSEIK